jgi:hypothetical protein
MEQMYEDIDIGSTSSVSQPMQQMNSFPQSNQQATPQQQMYEDIDQPDTSSSLRTVKQLGSRLVGGLAGGVGGMAWLGAKAIDLATAGGHALQEASPLRGLSPVKLDLRTNLAEHIPDVLSAKGFKEKIAKPYLGEEIEERTKGERTAGDWAETLGAFLTPIPGLGAGAGVAKLGLKGASKVAAKGLGKAAILASTDQVTDFLTKSFKLPEKFAAPIRIGSVFAAALAMNKGTLGATKKAFYDESKELIGDSTIARNELKTFLPKLTKAVNEETIGSMNKKASLLHDAILTNKKVPIKEMQGFTKELNQLRFGSAGKNLTATMKNELGDISASFKEDLAELGKKTGSEGIAKFLQAEELHQGSVAGSNMWKWAENSLERISNVNPLTKIFLGGALIKTLPAAATMAGGALAANAALSTTQIVKSLKYPAVRAAYANVVNSAIKGSRGAFINHVSKLNAALNASENK